MNSRRTPYISADAETRWRMRGVEYCSYSRICANAIFSETPDARSVPLPLSANYTRPDFIKRVAVRVRVCACMQKEVLKQLYPTPPFGERACNKECLVKSGKYIQPYSDCSLRRQDMTCT